MTTRIPRSARPVSVGLGTGSIFPGTIMALTSIAVTTGVTGHGRAVTRNGAVTLDTDTFTSAACVTSPAATSPATTGAVSVVAATTARTPG